MATTLRYLLLTALRDRLFVAMLVTVLLIALAAGFLGNQSVLEGQAYGLAFAAFAIRLVVIAGMVLFVAIHIRRSIENREMLVFLSRPISRDGVVLSWWVSFTLVGAVLAVPAALALYLVSMPDPAGLLVWTLSLVLEAGLMIAIALFFAFELSGIVAVALCCLGFYMLARIIGVLLAIAGSEFRSFADPGSRGAEGAAEILGLILPRLDLFGQSDWLIYGVERPETLALIAAQGLVYSGMIVTAAMVDFRRRRF